MNKKRTTQKLSAREITTVLNRRSKNYAIWIGVSIVVLLIAVLMTASDLAANGFSAFDYTVVSSLYIIALLVVLVLVPTFIQHLVNSSVGEKSRAAAAKEPASFSILRWTSFVTLGIVLVNSKELWANIDSIVVDYVALLDIVGIIAVGSLFALVMAGRYYDKQWKTPAGLVFTAIAGIAGVLQLFVIVSISI